MKLFSGKKKFLTIGVILVILAAIPLTLFLQRQEQDPRSRASASTTLYFNPTTLQSSPLVKRINDIFTLDLMVNPGNNKVSVVRYEINFNPAYFAPEGASPFAINQTAFPQILEGPIWANGKVSGTVSIGSNYDKAIVTPTRIATVRFKALYHTSNIPSAISYTTSVQILSVGENDQASENVLSSTTPAYVLISGITPTPTPSPTPKPPGLALTANPTTVSYNGSSTISWTGTNVTSCTASGGWTGTKTVSGSQSTGPLTSSRTYTLSCTGPGGSVTRSTTVSVGSAPTPTPTKVPTPTPTRIPTPTPTIAPQATKFDLTVFMHGIGNSGDNANPTAHSLSNKDPLHKTRPVTVEVYNAADQLVLTKPGSVIYNSALGNFKGTIDMGTTLSSGVYTVKVKSPQYLKRTVPGIQSVSAGQTETIPTITLVTGDVNSDNLLNILDYNLIVGCYSDFAPAVSCNTQLKLDTDITDDGKVNQFDYNLFLRDLSVQNGD